MFNLFSDTISALSFLLQVKCVHRDIKPPNIMQSDKGVYKVVDLGEIKKDFIM
jgi:serine/threonine protein kinase